MIGNWWVSFYLEIFNICTFYDSAKDNGYLKNFGCDLLKKTEFSEVLEL